VALTEKALAFGVASFPSVEAMKTLLVSTGFSPLIGGLETFALNLARGLQAAGMSVRVLTSVGSGESSIHGIPVTRMPSVLNKRFLKILPLLWSSIWSCVRNRPDTLLVMTWTHEGIVAYLIKQLCRVNYALVAHGSEILQAQSAPLKGMIMRLVFRTAELIVANSEFTKRLVLDLGIDANRVLVVNPPVDCHHGLVKPDVRLVDKKFDLNGKRVILTVSRLVRRKGHVQVIQVMGRLRDRYPNLVYVMTGEGGYRKELEALAYRCKVKDRIRMVGYVAEPELRQLYRRAEVYISPSEEVEGDVEGFGVALGEAGAHGIPVIAGNSGGVADAVVHGETGYLVDPLDINQICEALTQLLDNDGQRRRLGQNARVRVIDKFGIERQGARLAAVLAHHVRR